MKPENLHQIEIYKPKPKAGEAVVAVGCMVRMKDFHQITCKITAIGNDFVCMSSINECPSGSTSDFLTLFTAREITYDNGKTWVPCGVRE